MRSFGRWSVVRLVVVVAVAVFAVTGCARTVAGTAVPTPREEPGIEALPHSGAPAVRLPLSAAELRRIERNPCGALTPAQVRTLGLVPGKARTGPSGPTCDWNNFDTGPAVSAIFRVDIVDQGLSQLYETHHRDRVEDYFFAMPPINGLPVLASTAVDTCNDGICRVQVGLTNRKVVYLSVTISKPNLGVLEPCDKAHDVAVLAVQTMRSAA